MVKYIHYGSSAFFPEKFRKVENVDIGGNKPRGGLWASRVDAKYGWANWCNDINVFSAMFKRSFQFTLSNNAKILEIHCMEDLSELPKRKNFWSPLMISKIFPDFEKMMDDGIDAVELFLSDDEDLFYGLYGWDCDSILIMNPEIIITEEGRD